MIYIQGPNRGACTTCPAGKFKAQSGPAACTDCPSGTYSSSSGAVSAGTCVACPTHSSSPPGVCGALSHHSSHRMCPCVCICLCVAHYHNTSSHCVSHHHITHAAFPLSVCGTHTRMCWCLCVCARARTRECQHAYLCNLRTDICKRTNTSGHACTHIIDHTHAH